MNKTAFASFIAFWSVIATLLAVSALLPSLPATAEGDATLITPEELARHNREDDCWMAIEGYVYDFTSYIPHHPTPAAILTPWCGREATEGMRTKGYGRDHTPAAWSMMSEYLVGVLAAEEQADAD